MRGRTARAFTLIELLVVVAIIALLIGILLPALGEARRTARTIVCTANLQQLGVATQSYAADYQDRIWAFNWKGGADNFLPVSGGLPERASSDMIAAAIQAIDILHRRADREDMDLPGSWIPHVLYTHLIVQDYLAARLPEPLVVCPEDVNRQKWQEDPRELHDNGFWLPLQEPVPPADNKRWPYSSSYQVVPASYDRTPDPRNGVHQVGVENHRRYASTPSTRLEGGRLANVQFPGNKVHIHDSHQRHFTNKVLYFGFPESRQPILMFDGSVNIQLSADANKGWRPTAPGTTAWTLVPYEPDVWEGDPADPALGPAIGYYRWTRGGLAGIDFGGKEIDTGQL